MCRLAEELLAKESINLPAIIKVLGDRPFPLKESVREYLEELETREQKETTEKEAKEASAGEAEQAGESGSAEAAKPDS